MTRNTALLACTASVIALAVAAPAMAQAQTYAFDLASKPMTEAVQDVGRQTGMNILVEPGLVAGRRAPALRGEMTTQAALAQLLSGSGLEVQQTTANSILIRRADQDPQGGSAGDVDALIVTAQKREENIQDVPIAISAFTQEDLTTRQVAGGPDLMTQIPNFTFTKTNFTGYSVQIRGIGTQAISATVDPAVAVAFNNTPFIRNRFFEQEFYDLARVEVLRGPQGTLYGRNATAGVVNLISAKPTFGFETKVSGDLGNYSSRRLEAMVNIPLAEDVLALRLAGAWTTREGYATNELTGSPIDGRDLWSTRATLRFEPTDRISANLIWEHFEEDDNRLRSGKQVCNKDPGPSEIAGVPIPSDGQGGTFSVTAYLSQGCLPASMYGAESYQTPNGYALPFYAPTSNLGNGVIAGTDPYLSTTQSRDLRVIESMIDPEYRAKTDTVEFQVRLDLTDTLTLDSETAYSADTLFSMQDYNRFNTKPGAFRPSSLGIRPGILDANNVLCDPQIGCTDRLMLLDLSTAESQHFSQEFRLSSAFDGPLNFSLGANYLRYDTEDKYYVFINSLSMFAAMRWNATMTPYINGVTDNTECMNPDGAGNPRKVYEITPCIYVDPNPIGSLNDKGRNYFLSKNPYRLISYAGFGEVYYEIADNLKLTGGLRWTVDKKHAPLVPSWLLASGVTGDYPVAESVDQEWSEPTGRVAIDWKPELSFTDETLLYASYAHGYKAGGANPPPPVIATYGTFDPVTVTALQTHPKTFDAEFIDAFEVGMKNTLLDGRMTLNLGAFYYDYKGYQISQIVNRSAVNLNFDAEVWGLEVEADWRPMDNLRLGFKGGYQNTRLADGSAAIDMMDRTAGRDDWIVVKPFPTIPSNCVLPTYVATQGGLINVRPSYYNSSPNGICVDAYYSGYDPLTMLPYRENPTKQYSGVTAADGTRGESALRSEYAGYRGFDPLSAPNGGAGFSKDISGNELPNAPNITATLMADYTIPLPNDWLVTLHSDFYYQSEAWTRVFNTDGYDKLKAYTNVNFAAIFNNEESGLQVMAYVKNVFDRDSITGAFLNSDDTGLTTNVFLTEPRIFGVRVTKQWTGEPWWGAVFAQGGEHPFEIEFGGGVTRFESGHRIFAPAFVDEYKPSMPFPLGVQSDDMQWADQREVKLTYAPASDWKISLARRWGQAANSWREAAYEKFPDGVRTTGFIPLVRPGPSNSAISSAQGREEYDVIDFTVGKEAGLGLIGEGGESLVSLGLRFAKFDSIARTRLSGTPDWHFPESEPFKYPTEHHSEYSAWLDRERSFEGAGPVLSWEATKPLLGDERIGRLGLDWSLSGGVLFGKQEMQAEGHRFGEYIHWKKNVMNPPQIIDTLYDTPIDIQRSREVTVPTWSASLGLSYGVDRIKISAGYRWDRYLDAIDGGAEEAAGYDRGTDGPYLKIRFGFGG